MNVIIHPLIIFIEFYRPLKLFVLPIYSCDVLQGGDITGSFFTESQIIKYLYINI